MNDETNERLLRYLISLVEDCQCVFCIIVQTAYSLSSTVYLGSGNFAYLIMEG